MIPGQRIGVRFESGIQRYYDIDPDGRVYWLRPAANNKLTRYRVYDPPLIDQIKSLAKQAKPADIEAAEPD